MNNLFDTDVQALKNRILTAIAEKAYANELTPVNAMNISRELLPDGSKPTMRCCIYKERAIMDERIKVAMGTREDGKAVIQVISIACDECPADGMLVTESCRGCLAHRCMNACPKNAIEFDTIHRHAVIDKAKCIQCGRCMNACSYGAILKHTRPCVNACKPGALTINRENQKAHINEAKCISCGQCVYQCPFGAVQDKSYITEVIGMINGSERNTKYHVYAIVAPAIASQYDTNPKITTPKIVTAINEGLGFHATLEAAWGADMVAYMEAHELMEQGFLTSSCCPAFVNYIHQYFPTLVKNISSNLSPMAQLCKVLKENDPGCKCVFIGPCIAKKTEIFREAGQYCDSVLTFEELHAMFVAKGLDLENLEETELDNASYFGRIFARTGGLTDAVAEVMKEDNIGADQFEVKPVVCNGLAECKKALMMAKVGRLKENFIEGMCCENGCIGGPACLNHNPKDKTAVDKYGRTAAQSTIKGAIRVLEQFENV